jgi:hypothetical protein
VIGAGHFLNQAAAGQQFNAYLSALAQQQQQQQQAQQHPKQQQQPQQLLQQQPVASTVAPQATYPNGRPPSAT